MIFYNERWHWPVLHPIRFIRLWRQIRQIRRDAPTAEQLRMEARYRLYIETTWQYAPWRDTEATIWVVTDA